MSEEQTAPVTPTPGTEVPAGEPAPAKSPTDEFEIGEHKVPWFLWVFFTFIVVWASVAWIPFFGY